MFNLRNAYLSGVPLFVVNGTEDSRFLVHNPVLGGPNTQLAETATKYQYEVRNIDELTVAMQRCWVQAGLQPTRPVFLSVPMDFMQGSTERITFKRTQVFDDTASASIAEVAEALRTAEKLAIVVDYAVGWDRSVPAMTNLAAALDADIYAAPFHVQGVCDMLHPTFKGALPPTTKEVREILSGYDTALLLGEKLDTFTYTGDQSVPPEAADDPDHPGDRAARLRLACRHRRRRRHPRPASTASARALGVDVDAPITGADVAPDLGCAPSDLLGSRPRSVRRADPRRVGAVRHRRHPCRDGRFVGGRARPADGNRDGVPQRPLQSSRWCTRLGDAAVGRHLARHGSSARVLRRRRREPVLRPLDLDRRRADASRSCSSAS